MLYNSDKNWSLKELVLCVFRVGKLEQAYMVNIVRIHIPTVFISDTKKCGSRFSQSFSLFSKVPEATDKGRNQSHRRPWGVTRGQFLLWWINMIRLRVLFGILSSQILLSDCPKKLLLLLSILLFLMCFYLYYCLSCL